MYMLHTCTRRVLGVGGCSRVRQGRRRHLVLEPLSRARACDVESVSQYSYQFLARAAAGEWEWDRALRHQPEPEILRYANHVADRFDLRRDIRFENQGHPGPVRRDGAGLDGRDRAARDEGGAIASPPVSSSPDGLCLSSPQHASIPAWKIFKGPDLSHRQLAA